MQKTLLTVKQNTNVGNNHGTHDERLLTRSSAKHFHAVWKYVPKFWAPPPFRRWRLIPSPWRWSGLGDLLLTNRIKQKWWYVSSETWSSKGTVAFSSCLDHSLWEKLAAMSWGYSGTCWEAQVVRNEDLLQAASKELRLLPRATWGRQLRSGFSSPSQIFRWVQPLPTFWLRPGETPGTRSTPQSHSWIPDPQTQWS